MNKDRRMSTPIVGGSSLLVIFAVLCLTVFALLGLSTVQAGGRLSQKMAQSVYNYYEADYLAEEIYARLRSGEMPAEVTKSGNIYTYVCPISDTEQLQVAIENNENKWSVIKWQAASTVEWESDEFLELWDGELE